MATDEQVAAAVRKLVNAGLNVKAAQILVANAHGRDLDLEIWTTYLIGQRHYYQHGLVKS